MLNFDEPRYVDIQSGAVGLAPQIQDVVRKWLDNDGRNLAVMGAGGAGILMQPAADLLRTRSSLPMHALMPAEVVVQNPAFLGPGSLVVVPSRSGTTRESIDASSYCRARGATVLTLVAHADTPLGQQADVSLVNFAADDTSSESFYVQSLLVALAVLDARGELSGQSFDQILGQLALLPSLLVEAKRAFESRAASFAEEIKDSAYHIITGAGSTWPEAHYYGMCILEEMQWIRTRPVHASDFFHGTLELVEQGVSVMIFKGEDDSRSLTERVERFAPHYTDSVWVLDSAEAELPGISPEVRSLISPIVLAALLERLSAHLEVMREHPLTTRRYYNRVAY